LVTLTRRFSILLHNKRMKKEKKKEKRRKEEKRRHEKKKEEKRRRGEEKGRERKEGRKEGRKGAKIVTFTSAECHWGRRPRQEGERGEMGKVKPRSRDFEILLLLLLPLRFLIMSYPKYGTLLVERLSSNSGVLHVMLNRPEKLNAMNGLQVSHPPTQPHSHSKISSLSLFLSRSFWRECRELFQRIDVDADTRCVVISGNGKGFSSGLDSQSTLSLSLSLSLSLPCC